MVPGLRCLTAAGGRSCSTEQAAVARLWIAFRDLDRRTGLNATQKMLSGDMWERVRLFRTYQTKVIPGLLQTAAYMTAILTACPAERGVQVDDVAERSRRADRAAGLPAPA